MARFVVNSTRNTLDSAAPSQATITVSDHSLYRKYLVILK